MFESYQAQHYSQSNSASYLCSPYLHNIPIELLHASLSAPQKHKLRIMCYIAVSWEGFSGIFHQTPDPPPPLKMHKKGILFIFYGLWKLL